MFSKGYLDSNVYVGLARKKITEKQLRKHCGSIRLCNINIIEIISKTNSENFKFQQLVASQTKITTGSIEQSTNRLLTSWALPEDKLDRLGARIAFNWFIGAKRFEDIKDEIVAHVKPLKDISYLEFKKDVEKGISDWKKKFDQIKSQIPKDSPDKNKRTAFSNALFSDEVLMNLFKTTRVNAYELISRTPPTEITDEELTKALKNQFNYLLFYIGYCVHGIQHQIEFNDFGDLDLMRFLDDDSCVITNDVKMLEIAKEVGLEDKIIPPK